jgi:hypothetical protein
VRPEATLYALADERRLWAVFDVAGAPAVYDYLAALDPDRAAPLARGDLAEQYAAVTPWLARLDAASCAWIRDTILADPAQADSWGIYVVASSPEVSRDALRRRLGRLLTVRLPEGGLVRFRFYDPRVMQVFLGSASQAEVAAVFGREIVAIGVQPTASANVAFAVPHGTVPHLRFVVAPRLGPGAAAHPAAGDAPPARASTLAFAEAQT